MHILRTAPPGASLADWVPAIDQSHRTGLKKPNHVPVTSVTVTPVVLNDASSGVWQQTVSEKVAKYPNLIVQLENDTGAQLKSLPGERKMALIQHITENVPKYGYSRIVVPSFYARERLSRYDVRRVTTIFPTAPPGWQKEEGNQRISADMSLWQRGPLNVLLHPNATTKRLLNALLTLSKNRLRINWWLVRAHGHRYAMISDQFKQEQQITMPIAPTDPVAWQQADVIITDQHPAWSLNPLHVRCMALGIPILTTSCGDHPELVKHMHNGLLLSLGNLVKDCRYYLNVLVKEPSLLQQFSGNTISLYKKYYREPHIVAEWETLYRNLPHRRKGRGGDTRR